ncbi:hypothetical protein JCGZ_08280 [Jatropha curcas]|uniref:Uncharacterized protein n=1 Tax=Jatropha curcas TaxID=180498 RepID=A0A067KZZ6_JATCU|nr:hypothetical protein JCGZ_08280 [Jatropha curcas]
MQKQAEEMRQLREWREQVMQQMGTKQGPRGPPRADATTSAKDAGITPLSDHSPNHSDDDTDAT